MTQAAPTVASSRLRAIKAAHTLAWAFFASAIVAIPVFAWRERYGIAFALAGVVLVEVVILLANRMTCPLTPLAAKHTADRSPNFDIYLPAWLAARNKAIFGTLYVAGTAFLLVRWAASRA